MKEKKEREKNYSQNLKQGWGLVNALYRHKYIHH